MSSPRAAPFAAGEESRVGARDKLRDERNDTLSSPRDGAAVDARICKNFLQSKKLLTN
jgi:hypothetical protein